MKFESPSTNEQERQELIEIIELPQSIKEEDPLSLEEDKITHYFLQNSHSQGSTEWFTLPTEIDAMGYHFDLYATYGMHELSFGTDTYGYAVTNLSEEGSKKLEETLGKFVHSIIAQYPLKELYVKPAPEAVTVRDIEDCIEEIILKRDYLSREDLLREYKKKGWTYLFSEYKSLTGHEFQKTSVSMDRTTARARLFKMGLKRIFPDWEINEITDQKWVLKRADH